MDQINESPLDIVKSRADISKMFGYMIDVGSYIYINILGPQKLEGKSFEYDSFETYGRQISDLA